jgi:hypothetical protein
MESLKNRLTINVLTLHSLVVAKPVFDLFAAYPEYFIVNRIPRPDIFWFILVISFALPFLIIIPIAIVQKVNEKAGAIAHTIAVSAFGFGYVLQIASRLEILFPVLCILLGVLGGIGVGILYWRNERFPFIITLLSPIALLFPLLFLFNGNMQRVVFPPNPEMRGIDVEGAVWTESRPPIVFLVLDEFPLTDMLDDEGEIDSKRFPHFAALATESTWYANTTTVWPNTVGAVPAILTGKRPPMTKILPNYESFPENLFSMLQNHYTFNVDETTTDLLPRKAALIRADRTTKKTPFNVLLKDAYIIYLHVVLPKNLTRDLPQIDDSWGHFGENETRKSTSPAKTEFANTISFKDDIEERVRNSVAFNRAAKVQSFIQSLEDFPLSTLHFLHIVFPHSPFEFLPSGKMHTLDRQYVGIDDDAPIWKGAEGAVERMHQGLRLQEALADRLVGELIDTLKKEGIYDESLVIITADHGGSFINGHPHRAPTQHTFGDVAFIPLFIKYPNQTEGKKDDSNVETIDILPTIRDVIGAKLNWSFDGRSLADAQAEPRETKKLPDSRGSVLELTRTEYLKAKQASVERKIETFSLHDDRADVFRFGKGLEYIGQPESVLYPMMVEGSYQCAGLDELKIVDLNKTYIPLRLVGTVSSPAGKPSDFHLAFVINGKIEVFSKPMHFRNQFLFDVILPDDLFNQGSNTVNLLLVNLNDSKPIEK